MFLQLSTIKMCINVIVHMYVEIEILYSLELLGSYLSKLLVEPYAF